MAMSKKILNTHIINSTATIIIWVLLVLNYSVFYCVKPAFSETIESKKIGIIVSLKIRPYLEAIDGFKKGLDEVKKFKTITIYLENYTSQDKDYLIQKIKSEKCDYFLSVGPEAAAFIWNEFSDEDIPKMFTMVLNPEKIVGTENLNCGVSLNIPIATQLVTLSTALPEVRKIGLLYDKELNQEFANSAKSLANVLGLTIVPMEIGSRKEMPAILREHWSRIDLLWLIPDHTVITESLVRFVIKEAILNGTPVSGYNSFFYRSGAAVTFVTDYEATGLRTSGFFISMVQENQCSIKGPYFDMWLNKNVLKKLGVNFAENEPYHIKEGP